MALDDIFIRVSIEASINKKDILKRADWIKGRSSMNEKF